MAKCPKCKTDTVEPREIHKPGKKKLRCTRCNQEFDACPECGGTGCGDYPFLCEHCHGEGLK